MPVLSTAFQPSAFQNNAFQIASNLVNLGDTHDGMRKKRKEKPKRIFLPQYFSKKEEIPPVLPEIYQENPIELQELEREIRVSKALLKYDLDWDLIIKYAAQEQIKLQAIIQEIDKQRIIYEKELIEEDNDLMMMAFIAAHE